MADIRFASDQALLPRQRADLPALFEAAKPYLATVLIVAVLLSIWIGLRAG